MQTVCQGLGIGVMVLVETHGVPTIFTPVLPVLHQHVDRQLLTAEAVSRLQNLVGRMKTLTAVDIAQCPTGHQGCLACQLAITGNNLVGRTHEHGVIDGGGHR